MIKQKPMTFETTVWKRISTIFIAVILLSSVAVFNLGVDYSAQAKKPGSDTEGPISWSNGFPSGPHSNVNIHGKKLGFDCDNDGKGPGADFGSSVFVPIDTQAARDANQAPSNIENDTIGDINFVSNKRSKIENVVVRDPCSAPFGNVTAGSTGDNNTAALIEIPPGEHQVYWRILGGPFQNNGNGNDKEDASAMITNPSLIDQCDFLPSAFEDGSIVNDFDPDAVGQATSNLMNFQSFERFENTTVLDGGFSIGETIYNDTDTSGTVSSTDTRLANAATWGFADGSMVAALDADDGLETFEFPAYIVYNDTNSDGFFSVGETVYNDTNTNGMIDQGDVRLANAASQGLSEDEGGDALSCDDATLVGLGLVSDEGVFDLEDGELVRFGDDDNVNEKGKGNKKGKSNAINMTGLFQWTGSVCDAALLDGDGDNKFTFADFDLVNQTGHLMPDGNITSVDLDYLNNTLGFVIDDSTITDAEAAEGTGVDNEGIDSDAEFEVWLDLALEVLEDSNGELLCRHFESEWIFNVADIVIYGFDYENKGSSLTQLRFYPTETTEFTE